MPGHRVPAIFVVLVDIYPELMCALIYDEASYIILCPVEAKITIAIYYLEDLCLYTIRDV